MAKSCGQTMSFPAASMLIFLLLVLPFQVYGQEDDCFYEYLRQPPLDVQCNPYSEGMRLECQIVAPVRVGVEVEIQWFYNDEQIMLDSFPAGAEITDEVDEGNEDIRTSTLVFPNDFPDTFSGNYHCQIVVNGNFTAPSQSLTLVGEDVYIIIPDQRCSVQAVDVSKCAGRATIAPPSPSTTTQPENTGISTTASSPPLTSTLSPSPSPTNLPSSGGTTDTATNPNVGSTNEPTGETLQVWVYVLVAIAAVFGMIIVVLSILCVGLCLKKNKTEDTYKQKGVEIEQFTSNSMVSNGLYQRKDEGAVTSGTHVSSHSQISDYNTLEGRDYEEIDMGDDKHDYHHLQRPSPPLHVSGRNQTFQFTPPQEFNSMSTLTSQLGNIPPRERELLKQQQRQNTLPANTGSTSTEEHVYRELEQTSSTSLIPGAIHGGGVKDIYRSPTNSDSPDSAQLFGGGRGTMPSMGTGETVVFGYPPNESLYSPTFDPPPSARVQKGGLENVPETGTMFVEPENPTAFPVHKYEQIGGAPEPQYEKPIISRKKSSSTSSTPPAAQSANAGGTRPRTNSNASTRYETELPQGHQRETASGGDSDSQYSKLVRPADPPSTIPESGTLGPPNNSIASPFYAELGSSLPNDMVTRPQLDSAVFSHSSAELSRQGRTHPNPGGKVERGFTVPSQVSATGYNVVQRGPSVSSATDSLSSYITRLQETDEHETDLQLDGILFSANESRSQPAPDMGAGLQHGTCPRRNASFGARRKDGPRGQRAWSEERRDMGYSELGISKSGFSSSAMDGRGFHSHAPQNPATKMHRDLRANGFDPRLGDYARTKTMV